jgi:hypothetical protein
MQPKYSIHYGSPFRSCSRCGKIFVDKDYKEIALEGIRKIDKKRVSPGAIFFAIGGCLVIIAGAVIREPYMLGGGLIWVAIWGSIIVSEVLGHKKNLEYLEQETKRSNERLSNPTYAQALKNVGYHVPLQYLQGANKN